MSRGQRSQSTEIIRLTPSQSNIYQWGWQPEARFRTAPCGRRFGKTYLAAREIKRAARLAAQRSVHTDNEIWYGAPTFKQAKRVFWRRLKRVIPRHWLAERNETECSLTLVTGHVIRLVGLDAYDNLRGSGLWFFVGDEWADAQPECWSEVIMPMLATARGHSLKIGSPKGFNDFYDEYQKGLPGGEPDHRSWSYTTAEGGNVPPEEIARARRELDARTYEQEYEAGFVTYAGRVVFAFTRNGNVRPCPVLPGVPIHVGMDFNVNPMTATIWQEAGETSLQVAEVIIPTSDTDEMAKELINRFGPPGSITIHPDPSGASAHTSAQGRTDISILRSYGFRVLALTSAPLVRDRHNLTNARFQSADGTRRAFVDPSCRKSIEAYERLNYKEGTSEPDKSEGFDHAVDASGYYFFGRFGGQTATIRPLRL